MLGAIMKLQSILFLCCFLLRLAAADNPYPKEFFQPTDAKGPPMLGIYMGGTQDGGVLVHSVIPGTAADNMGLQQGDVITTLNGQHIDSNMDLWRTVRAADIGDGVQVTIQRDGKEESFAGTYGAWPDDVPNTNWEQRRRDREQRRKKREMKNGQQPEKGFFGRINDAIKRQQALREAMSDKPIATHLHTDALQTPFMHVAAVASLLGHDDWQFQFLMHVDAAEQGQLLRQGVGEKAQSQKVDPATAPVFNLELYYTKDSVDL